MYNKIQKDFSLDEVYGLLPQCITIDAFYSLADEYKQYYEYYAGEEKLNLPLIAPVSEKELSNFFKKR